MAVAVTGGCLCGAIRYAITGTVPPGGHCHCSMCRRSSGAPVVTWATVPIAAFRLTRGELSVFRSSRRAERRFCGRCGAQIAFWSAAQSEEIDITVATFDDAGAHPPDHHVYAGDRLPWLSIDPGLVAYPADTPPEHPTTWRNRR
jgi:hypothetical protein